MSARSLPVTLSAHVTNVDKLLQVHASVEEIAAFLSLTVDDVRQIQFALVNKSALVRAQLVTEPKTTRQVSNATHIPIRIASALLSEMRKRKLVAVVGKAQRQAHERVDHPLYALTEAGHSVMKRLGEVA